MERLRNWGIEFVNGKTTSAKRNCGRKSALAERDHRKLWRIVSKNRRCNKDERTAELNIHLEGPVRASQIQHPRKDFKWLLKFMFRCVNDGVTTIKPGHQTKGNAHVTGSDEPPFALFPASGRVYVWRAPKEAYSPQCLVPTVKHSGRSCDGLNNNIVVQDSVGPIITLHGQIDVREYVDKMGSQVHLINQKLFPKKTKQRFSFPKR
jgi:hypothetical protein